MAELAAALREAGLSGRVHVGVLSLSDETQTSEKPEASTPRGAEEGLPPFLRPSSTAGLRGRLIEIGGEPSSGRTALAYRLAAEATARGERVGWVDLPDALDPRTLRRAGTNLADLLWVRPPHGLAALRAAELLLKTGFALVVLDLEGAARRAFERSGPALWLRLQRAVREARATAVVLGTPQASGAFASLRLYTERRRALFEDGLFEGIECSASVVRDRHGPPGAAHSLRVLQRPH